jgi:hypothetical protein
MMVHKTTKLGQTTYSYDEIWGRTLANNHIQYTVNLQPNQISDAKSAMKSPNPELRSAASPTASKTDPENQTPPAFQARFIRITAKCRMSLPADHPGVGNPAWIFVDEIVVK